MFTFHNKHEITAGPQPHNLGGEHSVDLSGVLLIFVQGDPEQAVMLLLLLMIDRKIYNSEQLVHETVLT